MKRLEPKIRPGLLILLGAVFLIVALFYASFPFVANAQSGSLSNSNLDRKLAAYYEIYSSVETFERRITQAVSANGGTLPAQIEIIKSLESVFQQHLLSSTLPANASPQLESEVANSDLIIIGTPLTARSLPIQDRTFLFTEYTVNVEEVISAGRTNVTSGQTIMITRGGGEMIVDGVLIRAIEPAFDQIRINQSHIFMLRAIPNTDAFRALGSGTFSVENGTVVPVSHLPAAGSARKTKDLNSFLAEIDSAVARKSSGRN